MVGRDPGVVASWAMWGESAQTALAATCALTLISRSSPAPAGARPSPQITADATPGGRTPSWEDERALAKAKESELIAVKRPPRKAWVYVRLEDQSVCMAQGAVRGECVRESESESE